MPTKKKSAAKKTKQTKPKQTKPKQTKKAKKAKKAKKPTPKKKAKASKSAAASASKKRTQKTLPTTQSVDAFLGGIDASQRDDAQEIVKIMERVTGEKARMWGNAIVGFGNVHYKYESGHEGDSALVGFAPRASSLVLYLWGDVFGEPVMQQLGKYKTGKGCLYVKSLQDVDKSVLEQLIATSVMKVRNRFAQQG